MNGYIEVDSEYRDRNLWPLPGQFEIMLSQTGIKDKNNALDAVCDAEPLIAWTKNALSIQYQVSTPVYLSGIIEGPPPPPPPAGLENISSSSDGTSFYVLFKTSSADSQPQEIENYFSGLVVQCNEVSYNRILYYKFLGLLKIDDAGTYYWRCLLTVDSSISIFDYGNEIIIYDTTDTTIGPYPLLFVPNGRNQDDAYLNYFLYSEDLDFAVKVKSYDSIYKILSVEQSTDNTFFSDTKNFNIRKTLPIYPIKNGGNNIVIATYNNPGNVPSSTLSYIVVYLNLYKDQNFNYTENYYKNNFLRIRPYVGTYNKYFISQSRNIIKSGLLLNTNVNTYVYFEVYPPFNENTFNPDINAGDDPIYSIEILEFSYDNATPFIYTDTLLQQQSCYEFELINLVLPNYTLATGFGSKIAFYPYVYVLLSNVSSSGAHLHNILNSNNPNAVNMLFVVPIYDIQDPETTPFVRLISSDMIHTIKFKPDDNLFFTVLLPNGDIFKILLSDYFSPAMPNPVAQVSALFRYKRIN
jgi:hypothetical protein